jgi:hypothetical protein
MPAHSSLPDHRPVPRHEGQVLMIYLALHLIFLGCSSLKVQRMKTRAGDGDFEWIAAQSIDCDTTSRNCSQLHFIKADACMRLAGSGREPAAHYACAADALDKGIALNPSWESSDRKLDTQERLCESLNNLHPLQSGAAADRTSDRLIKAAQALYQMDPQSVPAVYYMAIARWRQVEPRLATVTAADRLPVCSRLKRTTTQVLSLMDTANRRSLPGWNRFADRYQRLAFDLGMAMHTAGCR